MNRIILAAAAATLALAASLSQAPRLPAQLFGGGPMVHAANNTALLQAPASAARLFRDGYATAGDGGGAVYTWNAAACSLNSGAGDNGAQVPALGGGCWLVDFQGAPANVLVWGADRTGASDTTATVQAAVNWVCTRGASQRGGKLAFPAGIYKWSNIRIGSNCQGLHLEGEGSGNEAVDGGGNPIGYPATSVHLINGGGPGIHFGYGASADYLRSGGMTGFTFYGADKTDYPVLETDYVSHFAATDVRVFGSAKVIKQFAGIQDIYKNWFIDGPPTYSSGGVIEITGTGTLSGTSRNDVTVLEDILISWGAQPSGGACIWLHDFAATLNIRHLQAVNCWDGLKVECSLGSLSLCPSFIDGIDAEFDFFHHRGLWATDFQWIKLSGSYFHGKGDATEDYAILAQCVNFCSGTNNNTNRLFLTHSQIDTAQDSCIYLQVPYSIIADNQIWGCNVAGNVNGFSSQAIYYAPHNLTGDGGYSAIHDNILCRAQGTTQTTMDGIYLDTINGADKMKVHDNLAVGCRNAITLSAGILANTIHDNDFPGQPSIGSCGAGPTIDALSTNTKGGFVPGTGAPARCTVTFSQTLSATPFCTISPASGGAQTTITASTSNFHTGAVTSGVRYTYQCSGL